MVFVKNVPKVIVKEDESHLTPKERMQMKKQREADAQAEKMRQGAIDAKKNYSFASNKKQEQLHAGHTLQKTKQQQHMDFRAEITG
jgi:hypothetical protein